MSCFLVLYFKKKYNETLASGKHFTLSQVTLPELLVWHENDFVRHDPSPTERPHTALLKWVDQYISSEKRAQLQRLFGLDTAAENTGIYLLIFFLQKIHNSCCVTYTYMKKKRK